jgi:hypothetical protein
MKTCGVVSFTLRPLNPGGRTLSTHCVECSVGPVAGLDAVKYRKISCPCGNRTPAVQAVAIFAPLGSAQCCENSIAHRGRTHKRPTEIYGKVSRTSRTTLKPNAAVDWQVQGNWISCWQTETLKESNFKRRQSTGRLCSHNASWIKSIRKLSRQQLSHIYQHRMLPTATARARSNIIAWTEIPSHVQLCAKLLTVYIRFLTANV